MKKLFAFVLVTLLVFVAGCIFNDNDDDEKNLISIEQLSVGGGVFLVMEEGYGFAEFGTFDGIKPYTEASVYVNGIMLSKQGGIHTNLELIPVEQLTTGETIKVVVYALGDSIVRELTIPQTPVINKPELGVVQNAGDSLLVEIEYLGDHQLIAMTLSNQEPIAIGFQSSEQKMTVIIPGEKLPNATMSILTAYSANTSGEIPDNFSIEGQFETFLVATVATSPVQFE